MRIFVDLTTGTWGEVDDLVSVDLTEVAARDATIGGPLQVRVELETMSNSEIIEFAKAHGRKVT